MLLTLCMLPFIWRGVGILLLSPSIMQVASVTTGLAHLMARNMLASYILTQTASIQKTSITDIAVIISAVFCENLEIS